MDEKYVKKLQDENALLHQAIDYMEWQCDPIEGWYCPWCWVDSGYFNCREERKHAPNCDRQKALGLDKVK